MKAKTILITLFLFATHFLLGQNISTIEKELNSAFQRIDYWSSEGRDHKNFYDSLSSANTKFENLLVRYTSSYPETLHHDFKSLKKIGLIMTTSEDGKFRVYSWDSWTGGSMHFFKNVYQYETPDRKIHSKAVENQGEGDPGRYYYQINDVISENKKYYLAQSKAILSSGMSYHAITIFSIDNGQLNDKAQLIKTQSGIKNQLGYEVDLTSSSNRQYEGKDYEIEYDQKNKIISIPLIQADSKVTTKKIRYQFKGKYFEKI
ncbi:hypothetical protein BBH99_07125 [Chryseobacterium contaminans]|uniref:Uncharacterized protein n=1 Tax=Chryseobacterium contaminans TaxID=1423959 RepID=A0A1M7DB05_9FLAO|nr:hypothetical protein [Chryseobacterium contaminans]OCA78857.1 hypothetical protein BBH99_07125 [Chryseobacterium contaminans]SHL76711.1 hypothetical protein SAMN05444407_10646 [Chryseobacterium contaminans]